MRSPTPRSLVVGLVALAGLATTAEAARRYVTGRVAPDASRSHAIYVGMDDHYMTVRGQGRSGDDLDCWVYDQGGDLVDRDTDDTDYCILETPGVGTHRVVIRNYGRHTNNYVVRQLEALW